VVSADVVDRNAGVREQFDVFFDRLHGGVAYGVVEYVAGVKYGIYAVCDGEVDHVEEARQLIPLSYVFLVGQRAAKMGVAHVEDAHVRYCWATRPRNSDVRRGLVPGFVGLGRIPLDRI